MGGERVIKTDKEGEKWQWRESVREKKNEAQRMIGRKENGVG